MEAPLGVWPGTATQNNWKKPVVIKATIQKQTIYLNIIKNGNITIHWIRLNKRSQAWWCMLIIPVLAGQRQADLYKFMASFICRVNSRRDKLYRETLSKIGLNKKKSEMLLSYIKKWCLAIKWQIEKGKQKEKRPDQRNRNCIWDEGIVIILRKEIK